MHYTGKPHLYVIAQKVTRCPDLKRGSSVYKTDAKPQRLLIQMLSDTVFRMHYSDNTVLIQTADICGPTPTI